MWGLEKIADAFDRMHDETQRDMEHLFLDTWATDAATAWGDDSWKTYGTALGAGLAYSLSTFVLSSGKALVDTLRLGEGVKSGTASGVGQDALRLLNVLPAVGALAKQAGTVRRLAQVAKLSEVAGLKGANSCGPTAIAAAARVSGQNVALTLEEVGQAANIPVSPASPNFPGMFMEEVKSTVNAVSLENEVLSFEGKGVEAVASAVKTGRGPVIFGIQYWHEPVPGIVSAGQNFFYANAPEHYLTAFLDGGKVMVADQFGVRPISQIGEAVGATNRFTLATEAVQIKDGAFQTAAKVASAQRTFNTASSGSILMQDSISAIRQKVHVNLVVIDANTTWQLDAGVRQLQGKPPREWAGMPSGTIVSSTAGPVGRTTIPAPTIVPRANPLSSTLQQDCMLVLGQLPRNGDSREFTQIASQTGLPEARLREAVLELIHTNLAIAKAWFLLQGKATPAMFARPSRH